MYDKNKVLVTCNRIIELEDNFIIDMSDFHIEREHECSSSYCIVGILAHNDNYPSEHFPDGYNYFDYMSYSVENLIGDHSESEIECFIWEWLFCTMWPNNLEHAKKRARILSENINNLPDGDSKCYSDYVDSLKFDGGISSCSDDDSMSNMRHVFLNVISMGK